MNCTQCGQPLPVGASFCGSCGTPAPPPTATAKEPVPQYPAAPQSKFPVKSLAIAAGVLFLLFVGAAIAVWLIFFPPGVYVQDSFWRVHPEIKDQIASLGDRATVSDGVLRLTPNNERFDAILYTTPASSKSTIESTVWWKEGGAGTLFGIVCCAQDSSHFTVLMITTGSLYVISNYREGKWKDLTDFMTLPKTLAIKQDTPLKLKIVTEEDYISFFLNDTLLAKVLDATPHRGRVGVYAEAGKTGRSVVAFDDFRAKKNSLFQDDGKQ